MKHHGALFAKAFLDERIHKDPAWAGVDEDALVAFETGLRALFADFPTNRSPSESDTETELIWPVLGLLGWRETLRQQNLSAKGRWDVPDGLLFASADAKARANSVAEAWKRYAFGAAMVESKRWGRPLDRRSGRTDEQATPSSQMLRYLRRVDDLTGGALRWGILTNGGVWRLYFSGARSVSEQFFEIDLSALVGPSSQDSGLPALDEDERRRQLKLFVLVFRRDAFAPTGVDPRSFHLRAIEDGRLYAQRVAEDLSDQVFGHVFPTLVRAIAAGDRQAPLQEVREGALILLYRLLFVLYAEDRDLLPVSESGYDDYGLRARVRLDVGRRKDRKDVFSEARDLYWAAISGLFSAIDAGDPSIGLPPYNGGLFDPARTPILTRVRIADSIIANIVDALSFERIDGERIYINYRNLSVQQLGSIYERLLEYDVVDDDGEVCVRPNIFARKGTGSYYTPDDLVQLILDETLAPLIAERRRRFTDQIAALDAGDAPPDLKLAQLNTVDLATAILDLKICDLAMGSGHFLVSLVDRLADEVVAAMAEAEDEAPADWGDYVSPLAARIDAIRTTIFANARTRGWSVDDRQLDDRHIIRRMALKRCVYGVDKNPMAVELAKVSLWLHSFTVGAPLSFLDHHLRCGDSLFGAWVCGGVDQAMRYGGPLLLNQPIQRALRAASKMQDVEGLTDAEIAEAHRSADIFKEIEEMTAPLDALMTLIHALDWLGPRAKPDQVAVESFFAGQFGDPVEIAMGRIEPQTTPTTRTEGERFAALLAQARALIAEERFLNWQVAFPGVWRDWEAETPQGGFDAVIGNPPWDRVKLQQVEWFAERRPAIATAPRAADRKRMITALARAGDPLAADYEKAAQRAEDRARQARRGGDYPLLSRGDVNLYALFVERAATLAAADGLVGLLTPSGIASDLSAAAFFKQIATTGQLKALYDFENRRPRLEAPSFFKDVHKSFKFCVFVFRSTPGDSNPRDAAARCGFFLQDKADIADPALCFPLTAADFARFNPNTGTAPIFRSRRDADLTARLYAAAPVLVDRSAAAPVETWSVRYSTMFHMTNDSGLFRTAAELEEQDGAYRLRGNIYRNEEGDWLPLYEGKMVQAFDHRAADIVVNPENRHRPAQPAPATHDQHADPTWSPRPQYWVAKSRIDAPSEPARLVFKDVTAPTNMRSMIAAFVPDRPLGNTLPNLFFVEDYNKLIWKSLLLSNFNAILYDFAARQKIQGQHLNWYIVEQLPVIPPGRYTQRRFGAKTAATIVRDAVLELTYTSHDIAPFAVDMGHVEPDGTAKPPFIWDDARRLRLRAKLDAVFFHLYGVTDRDDIRYIYSTFPIVERQEIDAHGRYASRDLCLAYVNALNAGDPDADITI